VIKNQLWRYDPRPSGGGRAEDGREFQKLARTGFYDGTAFHPSSAASWSGRFPTPRRAAKGTPGTGDPGTSFKAEFNANPFRGVISMARSSDPHSAGLPVFHLSRRREFLDQKYTAFGQLVPATPYLGSHRQRAVTYGAGREKSQPVDRVEVESITIVAAA